MRNNITKKGMMLEGENRRFFSSKGQVSLEMMVYVTIMILMLMLVSYAAIAKSQSIFNEKINMDARRITKLLAIEINTAVSVGDGYQNTFSLPSQLYGGSDYTIVISPGYQRIYMTWGSHSYIVPVLTGNITGTAKKGINVIENEEGLINIE